MRTIELEVYDLTFILECGYYFNKKGKRTQLLKNVEYFLHSEGIEFSCRLYVDDAGELGITEINGKKPEDFECFYTLEWSEDYEVPNLFIKLMNNYGFLPSHTPIEEQCLAGQPVIKLGDKSYREAVILGNNIYLLNISKNAVNLLNKIDYSDEHFYDIIEKIAKSDIEFSDCYAYGESGVVTAKIKSEGILRIFFENLHNEWEEEGFDQIKKFLNRDL